ncbi:hypothetical protein SAMN04489841_3506 [Natrinema salaciae]|uniref:Uncharacterized protein n=1 Tax=Natrinema salaciae TaxID=1186196 RepID=A0A1H9MVG1_9EURY|nr:hypothetical protein SAMN04489841_3506 [Natrinema salaciae]
MFADRSSEERIEELETEVELLENRLEREQVKRSARVEVDDARFLERYLEDTYKTQSELLQEIVESGAMDDLIRKRIEDELYVMAGKGQVEYEPGWGWRLSTD